MAAKPKRVVKVAKKRRRVVRVPPPFAPFAAWEISGGANCGVAQIYDEMREERLPYVEIGKLKRVPYQAGRERLGNLSDEQITELRRHLAERRAAELGLPLLA